MSTITLPNIRVSSDLTVKLKLKDGGVALDWSTLTNIKVSIYSDAQRALAGRCSVAIDEDDATLLVCTYAANKPQYVGVNRVVVSAKYLGETKTYDKPAFNFVRWTDDQEGQTITIDDPDIDVEISVEDVSSSILQEAVDAANTAAERANDAAEAAEHMVDIHTGPQGKSAYEVAVDEGYTGTEEEWLASLKGDTGETPDITIGTVTTAEPGTPAAATMTGTPEDPVLNLTIPKGAVGATPNFTVGTVTTGEPGTPVVVTLTGTPEAPVLNITIPQGMQGNTGSSVDYPYELVNNLTTNDATKGLSAAQGKVLKDELSQLEAKVDSLPRGKDYGFFTSSSLLPSGATEEGFAYVGATEPYAIWQFDGTTWTDSGVTANAFTANNEQVQDAVDDYLQDHPTVSGTFLNSAKRSLLRLLEKVAYVDEHGADYIGDLRSLLFLAPIDHIEAVYTQGNNKVYDIFDLDQLKENLVVMVHYTDGASEPTSDYTLSGTLQGGTSTITVSVLDTISQTTKTDTFDVSVTGTLKLYVLGDECTANSGGWQTKGFNTGAGSPVLTKESADLLIRFDATSTTSVARCWSTMSPVNLSAYSRILIEFEGDNGTGAHGAGYLWCYWPTTLAEGTSQAAAYGNDYSTNRNAICRFVDDPQSVYPRPVAGEVYFGNYEIKTTHTNGYLSFNLNFYRQDGQDYVAGAYAKIRKVALAAE